ncbi:response regulator transcription factor [Ideonella paludis]|uniref:response regulator transcription factor n=1 Tax=Ideonella paludis TaxID=1233411 RepID=UPI00362E4E1A
MNLITVALVEDDVRIRDRLVQVIQQAPTLKLLFAAGTAADVLAWLPDHAVDVLLVDLGLPDRSGLEVIREARRLQPACSSMVITMFGDEASMLAAFEAGARGYLLKDGTEADLAGHVQSLHAGGSPMTPIIARQLLARWQSVRPGPAPAEPSPRASARTAPSEVSKVEGSPRESEVLDLVARGFIYQEIAERMGVSISTVQTHVRNIYGKLGVHNKAEAVFEARQCGLLS